MAKPTVNNDTVIVFGGKTYNVEQFANEFSAGNTDIAILTMEKLLETGRAHLFNEVKSRQIKALEKTFTEQQVKEAAAEHEYFEEAGKDFRAEEKREGRLTYELVEFDFPYMLKAQEFERYVKEDLRIKDTEISVRNGQCVLKVYNVTDSEINVMSRAYKADKITQTAVGAVDNTVKKATDAVHYGATKIVAPIAKAGAKASASILKTVLTTAAKTAGGFVSATTQGIKSAATEIKNDPDVLKGTRDVLEAGDAIRRKIKFEHPGGKGIRVYQ